MSVLCAGAVWSFFVTEKEEDKQVLMEMSKSGSWRFRPSISCYLGDPNEPLQHPKGDASRFAQCATPFSLRTPGCSTAYKCTAMLCEIVCQ